MSDLFTRLAAVSIQPASTITPRRDSFFSGQMRLAPKNRHDGTYGLKPNDHDAEGFGNTSSDQDASSSVLSVDRRSSEDSNGSPSHNFNAFSVGKIVKRRMSRWTPSEHANLSSPTESLLNDSDQADRFSSAMGVLNQSPEISASTTFKPDAPEQLSEQRALDGPRSIRESFIPRDAITSKLLRFRDDTKGPSEALRDTHSNSNDTITTDRHRKTVFDNDSSSSIIPKTNLNQTLASARASFQGAQGLNVSAQQVPQETVVNVTIGRIEIRALAEKLRTERVSNPGTISSDLTTFLSRRSS
jgi:hypothetical protein